MAETLGKAVLELETDGRALYKGLDEAEKKGKKAAGEIAKEFDKASKKAVVGLALVAGAAALGVKGAVDLGKSLREVNTMFGLTGEAAERSFKEIQAGVRGVSRDVGIAQDTIAKGLYQAISAGVPRENAFEFLRVASKASIAGVTDVNTAVDGLTTTINAFGLQASDAERVSDSMFTTVKGGKTTFAELSASLFQVAPAAAAAGVSFQEVNAAIATLTSAGVPTAVATTQIRAALVGLQRPSEDIDRIFQKLGFTNAQAALQSKGLAFALGAVKDAAAGDAGKLQTLLGSVEAVGAAQIIAGTGTKKMTEQLDAQRDAAGATSDAFTEMEKSDSRKLERMKVNIENLAISLTTILLPAVGKFASMVETASEFLEEHRRETQIVIAAVASLATVIVVVNTGIKAYTAAVAAAKAANALWALSQRNLNASINSSTAAAGRLAGVLRALSMIGVIAIGVQLLEQFVPKKIMEAGNTSLDQDWLGRKVKNVPIIGTAAAAAAGAGRELGKKLGLEYKDSLGYVEGSAAQAAYRAGLAGELPTSDILRDPEANKAYHAGGAAARAGRKPASAAPSNTAARKAAEAAQAAASRALSTSGSSSAGSGSSAAASDAAEKAAAAAQEALMGRLLVQSIKLFPNDQAGPMSGTNADTIAAAKAKAEADRERLAAITEGIGQVAEQGTQRMQAAIEQAMDAASRVLEQGRARFSSDFGRLGEAGLRAFDAATSRMQQQLADTLRTALDEIEKARAALLPEEQAYSAFLEQRAAEQRAAARREAEALTDPAERARRLRELDLDDQERTLAAAARIARATRDEEARAAAAAAQSDYDRQRLDLDSTRALEREHFSGRLTELGTFLGQRTTTVTGANTEIKKLFAEFGVDPTFKQAGIDAGDGFAKGLEERLATALASLRAFQKIANPGVPSTAGEAMRAIFPEFRAFATGGIVTQPTLGLVGEAGPEAIIPLDRLGQGGGWPERIALEVDGRTLAEVVRAEIARVGQSNATTGVS